MKSCAVITRKHNLLVLTGLLFVLAVFCPLLSLGWFASNSSSESSSLIMQSQKLQDRTYHPKHSSTPVPTMPAPYLYTAVPLSSPSPSADSSTASYGLLGNKYSWRFSAEEIIDSQYYSNSEISISWAKYRDDINYNKPITFYVADILVQNIKLLKTAFANGTYNARGVRSMASIAKTNNCIIGISGDFSSWHKNGLIFRNGELIRNQKYSWDLCVLYQNGVMETYQPGELPIEDIVSMNPWQSWHFGPELLDHAGQPKAKFNTSVSGRNPRAVIGYYEPGHYCFVVVDGRQGKYSGGLSMKELSKLMYSLGCTRAYNLDGGATAHMSWKNSVINSPSKDRKVHDIICVCFPS